MNYRASIAFLLVWVVAAAGFSFSAWAQAEVQSEHRLTTQAFEVDGLKVIYKPSVKESVSVRLFVEGGTSNYPASAQGIEAIAFELAMSGGTDSLDKDAFSAIAENLGTSFSSEATTSYSHMSMLCLKMNWDTSWKLFTDAVLHPAMPAGQFSILKEQMIAAARQEASDPDARLRDLARENAWDDTSSVTKDPDGTPETLTALTLEQVTGYYSLILGKARCFLVVVGNVDEADLRAKIAASLAQLPEGEAAERYVNDTKVKEGAHLEARNLETNYILGLMNAPEWASDDYVANQLAMSLLNDRFFRELRTKRSLSYAPAAFAGGSVLSPTNGVYISTTDPAQSLKVMIQEINAVKTNGFSEEELEGKKQMFLTRHYMGQETNADIAMALGTNEVAGNWRRAETFSDQVNTTTLSHVNDVFRRFTDTVSWVYLGKEGAVDSSDFLQPQRMIAPGSASPSTELKKAPQGKQKRKNKKK
ncbi:Predicted Zn-dependent peptidase [Catalinimonas alkaloidigena]|uniref:Predicted Zn-dependent peptidase n=1 Tax=Catalinimonas alkaloidigena TaxID=1075417 RepID=A0A1G9ABT8_9BACT|nr:pitrilysin family protein [Catalinimonas alkaloidigena]SDK24000.1 Predicted Zn-dependent peptidase [Catalinimonas alkaloidigena]